MTTYPGERNPNWKGGRTVTEHGYVLVKMPNHPHADVRGYVYEHVAVATAALGRPLAKGEEVHHKNEDHADNAWSNLEVLTRAEHRLRHRKHDKGLRLPSEANPMTDCACGCGAQLSKYDDQGRPRRFVSGHNTRLRSKSNGR